MSIVPSYRNKMLDSILHNVGFKLSLHTAIPNESGSNEVSGGGYTRKEITFKPASAGLKVNAKDIEYTEMPATIVTHLAVWDNENRMVAWYPLLQAEALNKGNILRLKEGRVIVSVGNNG